MVLNGPWQVWNWVGMGSLRSGMVERYLLGKHGRFSRHRQCQRFSPLSLSYDRRHELSHSGVCVCFFLLLLSILFLLLPFMTVISLSNFIEWIRRCAPFCARRWSRETESMNAKAAVFFISFFFLERRPSTKRKNLRRWRERARKKIRKKKKRTATCSSEEPIGRLSLLPRSMMDDVWRHFS